MRPLQLLIVVVGLTSCAGPVAESATFTARHRESCARLQATPRSLLERMVKDAAQYPDSTLSSEAHPGAGTGSLSREEIQETIHAHIGEVRACYQDALREWPHAKGRVDLRFAIGPSGAVEAVALIRNETGVEPLACCVADAVRTWTFRRPDGGGIVMLTYPFILESVP